MKQLRFAEILLTSLKEKKARRITFDSQRTIIDGENDTGKSALLKSIYRCLGAIPPRIHETWRNANVKALLKFTIDGVPFSILQDNDAYTVFDGERHVIRRCTSVTNQLAPLLADMLDIQLRLVSRKKETIAPPPRYIFLPFYVDQDKGWGTNWDSFTSLQQLTNWRNDVIDYHLGIKPNEYYMAKGQLAKLEENIVEPQSRYAVLKNILKDLRQRLKRVDFSFNIDDYQEQIERLLIECESLKKKEEAIKERMVTMYNRQALLASQIDIAKHAMAENSNDYHYVTEHIEGDVVECPICGAEYENSFTERFAIARDQDRCHELLTGLLQDHAEVSSKIEESRMKQVSTVDELQRIEAILQERQGQLLLKDIIDAEGQRQVRELLETDIETVKKEVFALALEIDALRRNINKFGDKERRQEILDQYRNLMRSYLYQLNVHDLSPKAYNLPTCRINETGSDHPRALLAYYYSILHVMGQYSSTPFCPIIVDAPNQQDQDEENIKKMLILLRDEQPPGSQLILGLVEDFGIDLPGKRITLTKKRSLLLEDEYDDVMSEFRPMLDLSMFANFELT
ncbi:MAG: hypothetical protein ACOYOS_06525 [Syntrophales bacterium]